MFQHDDPEPTVSHCPGIAAELRRYTDDSVPDQRFIEAVLQYARAVDDPQLLDRLLRVFHHYVEPHFVQRVPGDLLHHPDLPEALVNTYRWLVNVDPDHGLPRLLSFKAWTASCTCRSYGNWVYNSSYSYRLKDLRKQQPDRAKRFKEGSRNNPDDLDSAKFVRLDASKFSEDGSGVGQDVPALGENSLERLAHAAFYQELEDYLREDPEQRLRRCCGRDPACNAYDVVQQILMSATRPSVAEIEQALNLKAVVDYQWDKNMRPLLLEIFTEIAARHGIVLDFADRFLPNAKKKNRGKDGCS
jgi:hypothetical protein